MGCGASSTTEDSAADYSSTKNSAHDLLHDLPPDVEVGRRLKDIPIFKTFSENHRDKLGGCMEPETFKVGETIFSQGEDADKFYVITKGKVAVEIGGQKVAELSDNEYFGEGGLMDKEGLKRGGTIKVTEDLECLTLTKQKFTTLFGNVFKVNFANRRAAIVTKKDPDQLQVIDESEKVKTEEEVEFLLKSIENNCLFEDMDIQTREKIVQEMYKGSIENGKTLMAQGENGVHFYVVASGAFHIDKEEEGKTVDCGDIGRGDCVGDLALMLDAPRAATVVCTEDATLWKVDRFTYISTKNQQSTERTARYCQFLDQIAVFNSLNKFEKRKVAESMSVVKFEDGATIFAKGETDNLALYIVNKGSVTIEKDDEEESRTITEGQYFGEQCLLDKTSCRDNTAKANGKVVAAIITKATFEILLGPLTDTMKQVTRQRSEKVSDDNAWNGSDILKEHLKIISPLGRGSYGYVQLVKHTKTSALYALKALSKKQIADNGQQKHIMHEKNAMIRLQHPFLTRLFQTFKDKDQLYFLLEYVQGGELYTHLRNRGTFNFDEAKFFGGSLVLAFEYMHGKNTVYRDLKPENVLVSSDGYIKIADFGFAKVLEDGKTSTLCGTPEYLTPEILLHEGHGKGVDWWTIGVCIYEMLAGYTPFYDHDMRTMYENITRGHYRFPSFFNNASRSLIKAFLQKDKYQRLGVRAAGPTEVKEHEFFNGFDFKKLANKQITPPFVPTVKGSDDTSNFSKMSDFYSPPAYNEQHSWDADF